MSPCSCTKSSLLTVSIIYPISLVSGMKDASEILDTSTEQKTPGTSQQGLQWLVYMIDEVAKLRDD